MPPSEEDPRALKKRIEELEMENQTLKDLLEVLKHLPVSREATAPRPNPRKKSAKEKETHGRKGAKGVVQRSREGTDGPAPQGPGEAPPR